LLILNNMKTYYTKYFKNRNYEDVYAWLNEFERKRDGRQLNEYSVDIVNMITTFNSIFVAIVVFEAIK